MPEHVRKGARANATFTRRRLAGALALVAAFALGRSTSGTEEHRDGPAPDTPAVREADALLSELSSLEARLQTGVGRYEHMRELARRHEQVSAIACAAAEEHAREGLELARRAQRRTFRTAAAHRGHDDEPPGRTERDTEEQSRSLSP